MIFLDAQPSKGCCWMWSAFNHHFPFHWKHLLLLTMLIMKQGLVESWNKWISISWKQQFQQNASWWIVISWLCECSNIWFAWRSIKCLMQLRESMVLFTHTLEVYLLTKFAWMMLVHLFWKDGRPFFSHAVMEWLLLFYSLEHLVSRKGVCVGVCGCVRFVTVLCGCMPPDSERNETHAKEQEDENSRQWSSGNTSQQRA